ncbi:MAG: aminopeptidase [Panacagrimonas sp.]
MHRSVPKTSSVHRWLRVACVLSAALVGGCAQLGYYAHLAHGQIDLLSRREPIARIIGDPARDPELRRRLALVLDARHFAASVLRLPDNASYTLYADLGRPYAVWNVLATPEFSLKPVESCFPITGCLAYRGHYTREHAQAQADELRAKGFDVDVGGVAAYSTLGWFDDPVLSTMLRWSDAVLVGTVFHELTHQQLYIRDDTQFNESMARFVELQGLREYFHTGPLDEEQSRVEREREHQFTQLVLAARDRLSALYASPLSHEAMREAKRAEFARLKSDYEAMRNTQWHGDRGYDNWFARELNNASLLPFGLYDEAVPAFAALFEDVGRDWGAFHAACRELGYKDAAERRARMRELGDRAIRGTVSHRRGPPGARAPFRSLAAMS